MPRSASRRRSSELTLTASLTPRHFRGEGTTTNVFVSLGKCHCGHVAVRGRCGGAQKHTSEDRATPAMIPLLFGIQQLTEGVIWLSFSHDAPVLKSTMTYVYSGFSHVLWPIYVPFAMGVLEAVRWRSGRFSPSRPTTGTNRRTRVMCLDACRPPHPRSSGGEASTLR